jgi:hypothetical protein
MTLVVAGVHEGKVWIVGDMAVSGVGVGTRQRECLLKVIPGTDERSITAFAGGAEHGAAAAFAASKLESGNTALEYLTTRSRQTSADFLYAHFDGTEPCLHIISSGRRHVRHAAHIGIAFDKFQRLRHSEEREISPGRISTFVCGTQGAAPFVDPAGVAVRTMMSVIARQTDKQIGGWPTGYVVGPEGLGCLSYLYALTDADAVDQRPGEALRDGSAQEGGYSLSVTGLPGHEGLVIYMLQQPGGLLFLREEERYEVHRLTGEPPEFTSQALERFGVDVSLWVGGPPPDGEPDSVEVMPGGDGSPAIALASYGGSFTIHPLTPNAAFKTKGTSELLRNIQSRKGTPRQRPTSES